MNSALDGVAASPAGMPARVVTALYLAAAAVLLAALLHNHYQVIHFPYPLDYNEAAMLTVTETIVEGGNPFARENQPTRTSVYPVTVNLLAAPLTTVFGNTLLLHRVISLVFILASSLLVFGILVRKTGSLTSGFVAGVFAYAGFLYYSTPISGPNGLGQLLFLATIAVPWFTNFSRGGLAVAIVLGVLAFYTKQYFMAGLGYIALYLFLARSKQAGVLFGVAFTAALAVTIPVVAALAPYYFDITFFSVGQAGLISSFGVMFKQAWEYSGYVYPFYAIIVLYIGSLLFRRDTAEAHGSTEALINIKELDAPLLSRGVDYFVLCLLCSTFIFAFALGKNPGNYLSYLFQLVSPFLVIVVIGWLGRMGGLVVLCQLLLLPAMYHAWDMQSRDFAVKHENNWRKVEKIIDQSEHVYVSNVLLEPLLRSGKTIYQNAHTPYFALTYFKPEALKRDDPEASVDGLWEAHVHRIHGMIRRREFDAFLLNIWTALPAMPPGSDYTVDGLELMKHYYEKQSQFPVPAAKRPGGGTFSIEVWRPRQGEIEPYE